MSDENTPTEPPPPWERGTGEGFKTQPVPVPAPTVSDVLEVFGQFQDDLLHRLDERDKNMLAAIQEIGNRFIEHYERETRRADEHAEILKTLRKRTHVHASKIQEMSIVQELLEQRITALEKK